MFEDEYNIVPLRPFMETFLHSKYQTVEVYSIRGKTPRYLKQKNVANTIQNPMKICITH